MYSMELCKELQKVAIQRGIKHTGSAAKLADMLDVSRMSVFRWKAAKQEMGLYNYYKLMAILTKTQGIEKMLKKHNAESIQLSI